MNQTKLDNVIDTTNLGEKIEEILINELVPKSQDHPWTLLPNCAMFELVKGGKDKQLLPLGITVNEKTELSVTIKKDPKISRHNKYIKHQIARLAKLKKDPAKFWQVAWKVMERSYCFQAMAVNHVCYNWSSNYPLWYIKKLLRTVRRLVKSRSYDLVYKRVYIPKEGKDTYRPLGVPSVPWRVYNHLYTKFLTFYFQDSDFILPSQHGFIPGRGTLTAWREIMLKVINAKFIYECDLKQFFPTVNVGYISDILDKAQIPPSMVAMLQNTNIVQPQLPAECKLDESKTIMTKQDQEEVMQGIYNPTSRLYDIFTAENEQRIFEETGTTNRFEAIQMKWVLGELETGERQQAGLFLQGVPQGLPSSPFLSILTLKDFLTQVPSISYADDPVFYSDTDFSIKDNESKGIVLNHDKSSWVKRDGKWLKPLKYLGLIYDPITRILKGCTRKGSTLELPPSFAREIMKSGSSRLTERKVWRNSPYGSSRRNIYEDAIFGLIQSRLYSGSYNQDDIRQDFTLKGRPGSWVSNKQSKGSVWFLSQLSVFNASTKALSSIIPASKIRKVTFG